MQIPLAADWQTVLKDELNQPYFQNLMHQVADEYENFTCFPPKELIFNAFNSCSFEATKVVILGQDPYHGDKEANGLAFSVADDVRIPPSLRNIFAEVHADLNQILLPNSGNLERWANQGVLLLNATLTVRKDMPNSHKQLHWQDFTDAVIRKLSDEKEHLVFLLWGAFAQKKAKLIATNKHLILTSGHPSPMSANQGKWFGNKHFSKTNVYLEGIGKKGIEW